MFYREIRVKSREVLPPQKGSTQETRILVQDSPILLRHFCRSEGFHCDSPAFQCGSFASMRDVRAQKIRSSCHMLKSKTSTYALLQSNTSTFPHVKVKL